MIIDLQDYIDKFKEVNLSKVCAIENTSSEIMYATSDYSKIFNETPSSILKKMPKDLLKDKSLANILLQQSQICQSSIISHKYMNVILEDFTNQKMWIMEKHPICATISNVCIGVLTILYPYYYGIDKIELISKHLFKRNNKFKKSIIDLTTREREILFLLMHGYTYNDIVKYLECHEDKLLTTSTIKSFVCRLKEKFNVNNLQELVTLAYQHKVNEIIPPKFLFKYPIILCHSKCVCRDLLR